MHYKTHNGRVVPSVSREQMKEIDRIAIEETGPNLYQMMENAGRNLAELTIKVLGENTSSDILVLAGKGGNGGGGICAARHLSNRGYNVSVCVAELDKLKDITAFQLKILKFANTKIIPFEELKMSNPDLIIDAVLGYSLNGEPKDDALKFIRWTQSQLGIKISLDIPSGIDATAGNLSNDFIKPDLTLTLALPKTGLQPDLTGELFLGDIGITKKVFLKAGVDYSSPFDKDYIVKLSYI